MCHLSLSLSLCVCVCVLSLCVCVCVCCVYGIDTFVTGLVHDVGSSIISTCNFKMRLPFFATLRHIHYIACHATATNF